MATKYDYLTLELVESLLLSLSKEIILDKKHDEDWKVERLVNNIEFIEQEFKQSVSYEEDMLYRKLNNYERVIIEEKVPFKTYAEVSEIIKEMRKAYSTIISDELKKGFLENILEETDRIEITREELLNRISEKFNELDVSFDYHNFKNEKQTGDDILDIPLSDINLERFFYDKELTV